MKTWMKFLAVTLLIGVPAIPLGQVLWPAATDSMGMTPSLTTVQLVLFIALSVFEGLLFGAGIAFLVFGFPIARKLSAGSNALAIAVLVSITWSMASWWSHDGLHRSMGEDMTNLLMIEYGYHVTLMSAAAVLAVAFWRVATRGLEQSVTARHTTLPEARLESMQS